MRKLLLFTLGFLTAALAIVLELPFWICIPILVMAGVLVYDTIRKRRNGRLWKTVLIVSVGLISGMVYSFLWKQFILNRAEKLDGRLLNCAVELTDYPVSYDYGCSCIGIVTVNGHSYRVYAYFNTDEQDLQPGDILNGSALFTASNDGSSGNYYRSIGIPLKLSMKNAVQSGFSNRGSVKYLPQRIAYGVQRLITGNLPEDVSGFLCALLTGEKSGLSYLEKSELKTAGIYHALAVSGMHVAILMSTIYISVLHNRKLFPILGLPVLFMYCLVTGMASSVLRASVMQVFLMSAPLVKREQDPITSLSSAGLLLTVVNPWCLLNTGFQLSFLATAGIILFSSKIHGNLMGKSKHHTISYQIRNLFAASLSQTLSALILTLPLLVFEFGMVSVLGFVTNLLTVQAITICFTGGFLIAGLLFALPSAGVIAAWPVVWLIRYVKFVVKLIAAVPFAAVYTADTASVAAVVVCYLVIFVLLYFGKELQGKGLLIGVGALTLILAAVVGWSVYYRYSAEFFFTVLDVGQGQCILIESDGLTLAYDCGGSNADAAGEKLVAALRSRHYNKLDYLILSHYDLDHVGGCSQLFARIPVGILIIPDAPDETGKRAAIEQMAIAAGTSVYYISEDTRLSFGNGAIELYAPAEGGKGNEATMAIRAEFGNFDILMMGDIPESMEEKWLSSRQVPDIEILVAGHHGSSNATGTYLLEQTKPEVVVISVGHNTYGHPSAKTLERIAQIGAAVYRTDESGDITYRR